MNEQDTESLCKLLSDGTNWDQDIFIREDNGILINISCAINSKSCSAKTPPGATNQPDIYPRGTKYRFPSRFRGMDGFDGLLETLKSSHTCPGAKMVVQRRDIKCNDAPGTLGRWTVGCNKWLHQTAVDDSQFDQGKMARRGIKEETVLTKKPKGTKTPGIQAMYSKSQKKLLKHKEHPKKMDSKPSVPRKLGSRAESYETRCNQKFNIRLDQDTFFYLSTTGEISHNNHSFENPFTKSRSTKELDDRDRNLLEIMFDHNVNTTQMARVMTDLKGKGNGVFLPSTIYDMNAKTKRMLDLAKGIKPKMSDAEKILKKLEK